MRMRACGYDEVKSSSFHLTQSLFIAEASMGILELMASSTKGSKLSSTLQLHITMLYILSAEMVY